MGIDMGMFVGLIGQTLSYWWVILIGTTVGVLVGAVPGFSAANTIIILLPITLAMDPTPA